MVLSIKNFDKKDCTHYSLIKVKACCNRTKVAGFCTIEDPDGLHRNKICSTKMKYCQYIPKEEE